jgi:hypothetical protein
MDYEDRREDHEKTKTRREKKRGNNSDFKMTFYEMMMMVYHGLSPCLFLLLTKTVMQAPTRKTEQ